MNRSQTPPTAPDPAPAPAATAPVAPSTADRRVAYLNQVLPLLYPPPCALSTPDHPIHGADAVLSPLREFVVLPWVRRARLLAPVDSARLTAGAVRHYSEPQSRTSRLQRQAVVAAVRGRLTRLLLRDRVTVHAASTADHIEAYLTRLLDRKLIPSVHIGPARANRKPVLQLLDVDGHSVAFVKLGINDLTRDLVRAEAANLRALADAGFRRLRIPQVLATGSWHGHEVLACSALPVDEPRVPLHRVHLAAAMREVLGAAGLRRQRLPDSRYWVTLRGRLAPLADTDEGRVLTTAAQRLVASNPGLSLEFGSWHGDWTPWNMASVPDTILLWDWERFTDGVPVGFDPLHYRLQSAIVRERRQPRAAVAAVIRDAAGILDGFGVGRRSAEVTVLLYLLDLATRYLTDRQAEAGAALGALGNWLLPELVAAVDALRGPDDTRPVSATSTVEE